MILRLIGCSGRSNWHRLLGQIGGAHPEDGGQLALAAGRVAVRVCCFPYWAGLRGLRAVEATHSFAVLLPT